MKKGFTLLELIVVIIIIGVLASLGLPQFFKTVDTTLLKSVKEATFSETI